MGNNVIVFANGITYKGKLVEINENEIYLETETGWLTIPNIQIEQIELDQTDN